MDKEKILEMLLFDNEKISQLKIEYFQLQEQRQMISEFLKTYKYGLMNIIQEQVGEDGKVKYSNQNKRDVQLENRLLSDQEYLDKTQRDMQIKQKLFNVQLQISSLHNKLKIYQIYSRL